MSKKNGAKFQNRAARRFKDMAKVDTMSQKEIGEIFDDDMEVILEQVTAYRNHDPGAVYPQYIGNAFANLSTALYFYEYVKDNVKVKKGRYKSDLDDEQLESLRTIIADAYKKSATGFYSNQVQEFQDRNRYLSEAFKLLSPRVYRLTKKFRGLSKSQRRDLCIQVYGDPTYNMKFVHKLVNESTLSDKKKLRLLREMYGRKRFVTAVGAAMTIEGNNSDCIGMLFDFMMHLKKRKRAKYVLAYAEAYKRIKAKYFRIDKTFYDENKRIIKEIGRIDVGYKKAFRDLKGASKEKKGYRTKGFEPNRKEKSK